MQMCPALNLGITTFNYTSTQTNESSNPHSEVSFFPYSMVRGISCAAYAATTIARRRADGVPALPSSFPTPPRPRSGGLRPRGGAIAEVRPAPPLSPPPEVRPRQERGVSSGGGGGRGGRARAERRPLVGSANGRSPL